MLDAVSTAGPRPRRASHGLTMVELLIGMAVGLFIAAAGASLMSGNLRENRTLMVETRLMQDLRTAADLVTRDLRRAGYWAAATSAVLPTDAAATRGNPYALVAPATSAADNVSFRYSRDVTENNLVDSNEQFGFRLRNGTLEMQLGAGNWQAMTDPNTIRVTDFRVTPHIEEIDLAGYCSKPCPVASADCPPRLQVRSLALLLSGQAVTDARITRSIRSQVRLRNDPIVGGCPA
jgi:prepilin peptidase dependent protein B